MADEIRNVASYVEGLRRELEGAVQSGDKDHQKAVQAELDRVAPAPKRAPEKATAKPAETRGK